ncbi:uncharacterized protein L969DRAFT_92956 [Mixia osmundae IAM 14324]|uniref:Brix domain-containing protein n=1 Tax=Mixia osmundae (strain CBS 9802 / IAM 14324 / JCM 22182 / KY 12970) TaxID=764103 RepID=G7DTW4_MIXOS|nr:uncharacterized protein L969DRAFT_92956 [Mixia osmundae IAM 14324]KEI41737.1 hypothetical protein L969DRAFT_92956 [Mixia osmundae IAM 14324]GAA94024.1 hypothetical protein E5Q_00671 [Mixia osmundae IAM 14324]
MARRRKTRTHLLNAPPAAVNGKNAIPKSFVVVSGEVGSSAQQLVRDIRKILEPNTASRLKERKRNRLRDFIAMSGPLGVSHLIVLSQKLDDLDMPETALAGSIANVNLRLSRLPRGPTLSFKVLRYALIRDVLNMSRRPRSPGAEYATEPMLILNNFGGEDKHLQLMTTMFQNLFPPIQVHTMHLTQARRVLLLSYNATTRTIELRHYLITVRPLGISRPIRKIVQGAAAHNRMRASSVASDNLTGLNRPRRVVSLASAHDISDYVLQRAGLSESPVREGTPSSVGTGGFDAAISSASEASSDEEDPDSKAVSLPQDYVGRGNRRSEKRAIKLTELGPRLELGLTKIEEGVTGAGSKGEAGSVLFHELVHKTKKEAADIARSLAERRKLRTERRTEQEANVARKRAAQAELKADKRKAKNGDTAEQNDAGADGADVSESEDEQELVDGAADQVEEENEFAYEDQFDLAALGDDRSDEEDLFDVPDEEEPVPDSGAEQPGGEPYDARQTKRTKA